jgi:hypothetical protein
MTEKLQVALAEIIEIAVAGKDFVLDQAPDVINQLLAWNFTLSLIWFLFGVGLIFPTVKLFKWSITECTNTDGISLVPSIIVVGINSVIILANFTWLKILIAPKVYLLEYASRLIQ